MAKRVHEIGFEIAGRLASNFKGAFSNASNLVQTLNDRSRELRTSLRNLEQQQKRGEISAEEYADAHRRLTSELERTTRAQQRLSQAQQHQQALQQRSADMRGKIVDTAAMAAPFVGAAVAALGYEAAQKRVQIQSALTAAQSAEAFNVVRQAYLSGLGEDIQATADAYGRISQIIKGETSDQQLEILKGTLAIEKYWDASAMEVNKAVHNMLQNFEGLSKTEAMDIVVAGFRNGLNYSDDFLDTLHEYSPQFESLGYNAQQFYSILEAGKNAGAWNLDKVADAVKEFNIRAKDGSKTTEEGFAMIGLDAGKMAQAIAEGGEEGINAFNQTVEALKKIEDPVKRNQAGVALFGTQWEDLTEKVVLGLNVTADAADKTAGALRGLVEDAEGPTWSTLGRQLQDIAAVMGRVLLPGLQPVADGLSRGVNAVAAFSEKYPALTSAIVAGTAGLVGFRLAWLGASFAMNQARLMSSGVRLMLEKMRVAQAMSTGQSILATNATKAWAAAQRLLNIAMRMNPIGLVITAIGGLVAVVTALYHNLESVRNMVDSVWAKFKERFPAVAALIGGGGAAEGGDIPGYATGTRYHPGGPALVGERGPELLNLPRGSQVIPLSGSGGNTVIHLNFAPVINGAGPEILPALEKQQQNFLKQLKDVIHQQRRVAYS